MISPKRFENLYVIARVSCTARGVLCIHSDGGTRCCCARFVISGCRIGTLVPIRYSTLC